ncbi:hypothetical protein E2562_021355 [Oryza meyeriana var. granulata]|uniref:C2H2-type domain-containing protein n=1 Tax=Oryza meyeriana var. granulata TaxID=110450 RepID=A0A6G1CHP9_9ORYZ|nr:hypothetical protein E2562_021355 [Oryza meyeriana var. granulata]
MEFRFRAGDERSRSPRPPPTASSGSTRDLPAKEDGLGEDGGAEDYGGDSDVATWRQPSPAAAAASAGDDELRRAKKEKIRERILREEAEHWELEAEVRRELMEQIFPLLRRSGTNAATRTGAAPSTGTTALQCVQADSKANASASAAILPAKRKNPAAAMASAVSAATSSKRPKTDLTCAVCGITSTSEKAMQDHLNGKGHKKKAAATAPAQPPEQEKEEDAAPAAMMPASDGGFRPTKLSMLTSACVMYEMLQMDGYLLCEDCNVRTPDRVTMMCHLEGGKHVSKAMKLKQQAGKPPAPVPAPPKKGVKESATSVSAAYGDPEMVLVEIDGEPRAMRRLEGFLLCDICDVKAPSVSVMQSHLAGRKHKSTVAGKAKAEAAVSMAGKVGGKLEVQEKGAMAEEHVATNVADAPGEKAKKVASPVPAGSPDDVFEEDFIGTVDDEHHVVMRISEFLDCTSYNVRATSKSDMRLYLAGRKHKIRSMTEKVAMAMVNARSKGQQAAPLPAPRGDDAQADGSMAPIEVNQPAKTRYSAPPAAAEANSTTAAAATSQQVKIQVEGRMFVLLRQANGALLCEPCGERCSGKTDMVLHLYTREHWDKCGVRRPEVERKKPAAVAPPRNGWE